jgi:hypothetical protein
VDEKCLHLDVTNDGICTSCGINIGSEEFFNSLPDAPAEPQLGDLMGIIRLAEATVTRYFEHKKDMSDPTHPDQPRLRIIGKTIIRVPDSVVWKEVVKPAFAKAVKLGYKGTYSRWNEICREYLELKSSQISG